MKVKHILLTGVGSIGAFFSYVFGGFDKLIIALLVFMVIDFTTGLVLAVVFKKSSKTEHGRVSSAAGIKGLDKKSLFCYL